jgi:hypothetical protein
MFLFISLLLFGRHSEFLGSSHVSLGGICRVFGAGSRILPPFHTGRYSGVGKAPYSYSMLIVLCPFARCLALVLWAWWLGSWPALRGRAKSLVRSLLSFQQKTDFYGWVLNPSAKVLLPFLLMWSSGSAG